MKATNGATSLPEALNAVRLRPLFTLRLIAGDMLAIGNTPSGSRRVGLVAQGRFDGDRLSGEILNGGSDWQSLRTDGSVKIDVRLHLKTADAELITMRYEGIRSGPLDVMSRLDEGKTVDPADYYLRIVAMFETASSKHDWLNRIVAIGTGHRFNDGPVYNVFEVL